jgi:hypothetical protein
MEVKMSLKGYDEWKTRIPPEYEWDDEDHDPDCICWKERRKDCPVHGIDPDHACDEWRDRQMDRMDQMDRMED